MLIREFPRPCEISSHQYHLEGICLFIKDGFAYIEARNGNVTKIDLSSCYSIKFTDRL